MFEAVLASGAPRKQLAKGIVIACAAHAFLVVLAFLVSGRVRASAFSAADLIVTFQERGPARALGGELVQEPRTLGAPPISRPVAGQTPPRSRPRSTRSVAGPPDPRPAPGPEPDALPGPGKVGVAAYSASANAAGGGTSATATSTPGTDGAFGSATAAVRAGTPNLTVLPFGEGMTRPSLIAKVDPTYTREAIEAKVEGLVIARCVITTQGAPERCRILKGLPHMNEAVLKALATWRYTPVLYQGRPADVAYDISLRLVMH